MEAYCSRQISERGKNYLENNTGEITGELKTAATRLTELSFQNSEALFSAKCVKIVRQTRHHQLIQMDFKT